jgi:xanthine dehydrogenase YagR molybdenum-binding subunit
VWNEDSITLYDANQGQYSILNAVATAFRLPPERVRVIVPYVGGGFGSKVFGHPHVIMTVMAAQGETALKRQQMFALAGYHSAMSCFCSKTRALTRAGSLMRIL